MRPRLLVLSRQGRASLPVHAWPQLTALADVREIACDRAPDPSAAAGLLADVDVLAATNLCLPRIDETLLDAAPRLTGIVLYAAGYDHLDLALLRERGIALSVLPAYATEAVAEHCLAQLLALATRLHLAQDRSRGTVASSVSLRGVELAGRTLGVVGVGRIGSRVAELGQAIGMTVVGCDVDPAVRRGRAAAGTAMVDLRELLAVSDAVALCASAHESGRPIVGAPELRRLRAHAFVANVGRPHLVDTHAVVAAIRAGRLRGYAVDEVVLDPVRDADLLTEGRVLQTGHSAWWRDEVLRRGGDHWFEHIAAMLRGTPLDVVTGDDVRADQLAGDGCVEVTA